VGGGYSDFTECQKGKKLSRENFDEITQYTTSIVKSQDDLDAMVAYLIINDLGKVKRVVNEIHERTGYQSVDHDDLLYVGLSRFPEISPTFSGLDEKYQERILNGLRTRFNLGQFIQSENLPQNLVPLIGIDNESFDYYMLHTLYDIGGAAGHIARNGSLVINDSFWDNFKAAEKHLKNIKGKEDILPAYNGYLLDRANMLGLEAEGQEAKAVVKLCNMLRISEPSKAQEVLEAFRQQPLNTKAILQKELNATGMDGDNAILLYYAPATLTNALGYFTKNGGESPIKESLNIVLPAFARLYSQTRANLADQVSVQDVTTVMISEVAKMAGANPNDLNNSNLTFQQVGSDFEVGLISAPTIKQFEAQELPVSNGNVVAIGMGGGSDCIQAAMLAKILQRNGKQCNSIISIRKETTSSQDSQGKIGQARTLENHGGLIAEDIYLIKPETTGSGRFLENIPADDVDVYMIVDRGGDDLQQKIEKTLEHIGGVETIMGVDTGGDSLYPMTKRQNGATATPDQDRRVLEAINAIEGKKKQCCVIALGIDSPDCAEDILKSAEAGYYSLDEPTTQMVLGTYKSWDMTGNNDKKFGKTPLVWQQALQGKQGLTCIDIPSKYVLDEKNPWVPFVNIQEMTKGILFMDTDNCLNAIRKQEAEQQKKRPPTM